MTLHRQGYVVRGFEYSRGLVQMGRDAGLDLREGGMDSAEGQYDVVVINQVLEHIPDFSGFVTKLKSLMKPDGILYVGVPDIEVFGVGQLQNAHCWYFTAPTLRHYMAREGLFTDRLSPFAYMHVHGVFRQGEGPIPSLAGEYERIKAKTAPRLARTRFGTTLHHLLNYIP